MPPAPCVILATLNARYIHASLGLRYLLANMGALRSRTVLREFTISRDRREIADELLGLLGEAAPARTQVLGLGVYIWNLTQTCELVRMLKHARPALKIVLGGPEVSHELEGQEIVGLADHVVTGWGEVSFPKLCQALIDGPRPLMKVIAGEQPPLSQIALPYAEYSQSDLAHRLLYIEASRGCPFKCEFCLSSLDKTAWAFDLDRLLAALDDLYRRGARNFKFVDRTFNLKIDNALRILQFFFDRLGPVPAFAPGLSVHFEVIPDHLPDRLKQLIARFPSGVLQFELGIQTFNVEVQRRISRQQDEAQTLANLRWLVESSCVHLHADLIFGLPGESMRSFAQGFDRLLALRPHEIQLGMLKRLRGTPIGRHSVTHAMVFRTDPPYTVLQTDAVAAADMERFARLARYWDLLGNSGRFKRSLAILLGPPEQSAFCALLRFSDWLWARTRLTSGLTPEALVDHLFEYLSRECAIDADHCRSALLADYIDSGARARPRALQSVLPVPRPATRQSTPGQQARQRQHRASRFLQLGSTPQPLAPVAEHEEA